MLNENAKRMSGLRWLASSSPLSHDSGSREFEFSKSDRQAGGCVWYTFVDTTALRSAPAHRDRAHLLGKSRGRRTSWRTRAAAGMPGPGVPGRVVF